MNEPMLHVSDGSAENGRLRTHATDYEDLGLVSIEQLMQNRQKPTSAAQPYM